MKPGGSRIEAFAFTIPGDPVPKGRPRFVRQGKHVKALTPETTRTFENWVRCRALEAQGAGWVPFDEPLRVMATFYLERPKTKKKHDWPCRKGSGDLDNYVKALLDGMALAKVFTDDVRIVNLQVEKRYADRAHTDVEVSLR